MQLETLKYISNCSKNIMPWHNPMRTQEERQEYEMYLKGGFRFGRPQASAFLTFEQMEDIGMIGVYLPEPIFKIKDLIPSNAL